MSATQQRNQVKTVIQITDRLKLALQKEIVDGLGRYLQDERGGYQTIKGSAIGSSEK